MSRFPFDDLKWDAHGVPTFSFKYKKRRSPRKNAWASKKVLKLIARDGNKCCWCGKECDPFVDANAKHRATVEHLTRLADGGTNEMGNLAVACRVCNNSRPVPKIDLTLI